MLVGCAIDCIFSHHAWSEEKGFRGQKTTGLYQNRRSSEVRKFGSSVKCLSFYFGGSSEVRKSGSSVITLAGVLRYCQPFDRTSVLPDFCTSELPDFCTSELPDFCYSIIYKRGGVAVWRCGASAVFTFLYFLPFSPFCFGNGSTHPASRHRQMIFLIAESFTSFFSARMS